MSAMANAVAALCVLSLLQFIAIGWLAYRQITIIRALGHVNEALEAQTRVNSATRNALVKIHRWQKGVVDVLRAMNQERKAKAHPHEWR